MNPIDEELRARFGELRAAESSAAPGVSAVLHRTRGAARPALRRTSVFLLAGAAASVAAITFVVRQARIQASARQAAVTTWRSPTTSLMPGNPQTVLAPPPLLSSVLDGATTSTLWRKGD